MLRKLVNPLGLVLILVVMVPAAAVAAQQPAAQNQKGDLTADKKPIYKVKPSDKRVYKVPPPSRFRGFYLGLGCFLPTPRKGQFSGSARGFFPRVRGQISKGGQTIMGIPRSVVDFDEHLGLTENSQPTWTASAQYQVTPRWALTYSFTPMILEATNTATQSFNFMGNSYSVGTRLRSKWERAEHRAGLTFNVKRTRSTMANAYVEWLYIQDKFSISHAMGGVLPAMTWDDDKGMAVVGLEVKRCLANYSGSSLAIGCKGSLAFLGDHYGYDVEGALSYHIPISSSGRYGFVKGGYRYAHLKKDLDHELWDTTMDGAFVEVGFIF
ncbi:hypothetical protein ACFL2Q_01970 [Thermodesulfobacteriota bacterium]